MQDTELSNNFDMSAMNIMAGKIEDLKTWMPEHLDQGVNRDWEHAHVIWRREAPKNEADFKAALLDPGTAKICNFMGVRPRHKILEKEINEKTGQLRYVIAVELVPYLPTIYFHPVTGDATEVYPVVAEGVGSCTTREKKYKTRWTWQREKNLITVEGFRPEELKDYREKYPDRYAEKEAGRADNMYYMADSESLGLDNTLLKMAAKRAEMDAVFQLPGVAQRFSQEADLDGQDKKHPEGIPKEEDRVKLTRFMEKDRLQLPTSDLRALLKADPEGNVEEIVAAWLISAGMDPDQFALTVDLKKVSLKPKQLLKKDVAPTVTQIFTENGFTLARGAYRLNKTDVEAYA